LTAGAKPGASSSVVDIVRRAEYPLPITKDSRLKSSKRQGGHRFRRSIRANGENKSRRLCRNLVFSSRDGSSDRRNTKSADVGQLRRSFSIHNLAGRKPSKVEIMV
jgi:hypothetical protein